MDLSYGMRAAMPWMFVCSLWLVVLGFSSGCDVLDRGKLTLVGRTESDGGGGGMPPDAGPAMEGGTPFDGGQTPTDSGQLPDDGGVLVDAAPIDAAADASEDAEVDAGCDRPECMDLCPSDDHKTAPGECGCGVDEANASACSALRAAVRHRYRFGGTGTVVTDDAADADGTVFNTTLDGSSSLTLAGGTSNQYVQLPAGIISTLTDATFEAWVTWQGGDGWQRIFDFGNSNDSNGETYIFVTPQRAGDMAPMRATFSLSGSGSHVFTDGTAALPIGTVHHVVLVVDDLVDLRLYVDGALQSSVANTTRSLRSVTDTENWLGRSHYSVDPQFSGRFHELRIYDTALTAAEIAASFTLGPDPAFLE